MKGPALCQRSFIRVGPVVVCRDAHMIKHMTSCGREQGEPIVGPSQIRRKVGLSSRGGDGGRHSWIGGAASRSGRQAEDMATERAAAAAAAGRQVQSLPHQRLDRDPSRCVQTRGEDTAGVLARRLTGAVDVM
jgi:hypothetical protein